MYPFNFNLKDKLSYDSHTHFFGVGLSAVDFYINKDDTYLKLPPHLMDQELIRGFGWSNKLPSQELDALCKKHSQKYFNLSYIDGHSSFISNNLLKKMSFTPKLGKKLECGVILSKVERDEFFELLPSYSMPELKKMAIHSQSIFIENDISQVRHLTGNFDHWACLKDLEKSNELKLQIEVFFSEFMGQSLTEAIKTFKEVSSSNSNIVSAKGIKIFYDGSLRSDTAYCSSSKDSKPRITKMQLTEKMETVLCQHKLPLAVHTIGDLALEDVLETYAQTHKKYGKLPLLHLEHAPIFTKTSLSLLGGNKINCIFHFQPSHWIEDQVWYKKNKTLLNQHEIYPFSFLDENNYVYHFGSDAPVTSPSKKNTLNGLKVIEENR